MLNPVPSPQRLVREQSFSFLNLSTIPSSSSDDTRRKNSDFP